MKVLDKSGFSAAIASSKSAGIFTCLQGGNSTPQGYGGINEVVLTENSIMIKFNEEMTKIIGNHDSIKINFRLNELQLQKLEKLLQKIMFGYLEKLIISKDNKVLV
jgi:hypothetical protein